MRREGEGKRRRTRRGGEVKKKIFVHQALTGKGYRSPYNSIGKYTTGC